MEKIKNKDMVLAISRGASVLVLLIGLVVLIGWISDNPGLKSLHPDYVSMKANTAIAFLLSGLALYLLADQKKQQKHLFASLLFISIVLLIGVITFLQHIFPVDLRIDELFFSDDPAAVLTSSPGRMALQTAIGFLIIAAAMLFFLSEQIKLQVVAQVMALTLLLLSMLPIMGYVFDMQNLYGFGQYTSMALHTAICFFMASVALLLAKPAIGLTGLVLSAGSGGYFARRLIPLIILIPVVMMWVRVLFDGTRLVAMASDLSLYIFVMILVFIIVIWRTASSLNKLEAERVQTASEARSWHELMQYIIKHDPSSIAVHDNDLRYVFVSERYLQDYRVEEKDVIGKHHYEVFPDIPEKWREVHRRALKGEVLRSESDIFYRADGTTDYTRWECRPWHKSDGSIGGIILFTEVITERKLLELQLEKTASQLQMVLDSAGDGIFAVDTDGKATMANKAATQMLQFEEEELLGQVMHRLHHHSREDGTPYPHEECPIYEAFREGRVHTVTDEVFWRKDGSFFPVEYISTPIIENGQVTGAVVSCRDITSRKQAEEEINRLNTRLIGLINAIKELSKAHTLDRVRQIVAQHARALTNAEGATFVMKDGNECYYIDEDTIAPLFKGNRYPLDNCITGWVIKNKKAVVIEDIRKDERIPQAIYEPTFVKSLLALPVNQADPRAAIGIYWDHQHKPGEEDIRLLQTLADAAAIAMDNVNFLSELEDRVQQRTEQLQAANKELEAFSYSVSHDLRAPLRAIDGFTKILVEDYADKLDDDGKRVCDVIRNNAGKMGQLIDDLLTFSRLSRADIQHFEVDMKTLANSMYYELSTEEMRQRIEFRVEDLHPVSGDPTMIRQLWVNLISNALKYSKTAEKPVITITSERNKDFCTYTISDNGVGFDMKYVDKIFGVFQRLHSHRDFEGTGVGLAIVQRVVHKHGGQVTAHSEEGKGATFTFSLPTTVTSQNINI